MRAPARSKSRSSSMAATARSARHSRPRRARRRVDDVDAGGRKPGDIRHGAILIALAGALACAPLAAQPPAPSAAAAQPAHLEPLVYSIKVNGRPAGDAVLLRLDGTRLLARQGDWDAWHLARPNTEYQFDGETYYALDDAPGFAMTFDAQRQEAAL